METALTIIFFSILFCFCFLLLFYSSVFSSYFFLFLSSYLDLHMWLFTVCNNQVPDKGSCQYNIRNALLTLAYVELLGTSSSSCEFRKWGTGRLPSLPTPVVVQFIEVRPQPAWWGGGFSCILLRSNYFRSLLSLAKGWPCVHTALPSSHPMSLCPCYVHYHL